MLGANACDSSFFFTDTATAEISTLSLHDALPISVLAELARRVCSIERLPRLAERARALLEQRGYTNVWVRVGDRKSTRLNSSHTVISYAVFCLKKKKQMEAGHTW